MSRILTISGSSRAGSFNLALIELLGGLLEQQGATVTTVDLRALGLPIYDGDLESESGAPAGVATLLAAIKEADGLLISCPEYNGLPTPLFKNAIDWVSRPIDGGGSGLDALRGKPVALCAASPGALGGIRGMVHVRALLGNIGMLVLPEQLAVGQAHKGIEANARAEKLIAALLEVTQKLTRP